MCFPRFDSPSIFASLLDKEKGGSFQIVPQLKDADFKQMYLPETNVLLSRFLAYEGMVEITDFMPGTGNRKRVRTYSEGNGCARRGKL